MPLVFHDTLRHRKQSFEPLDPNRVSVYVCGPTVYDYPHIGNARPAVVFDTLIRLLRRNYPRVIYARNITDVEDKILAAAVKAGVSPEEIAEKYTRVFRQDMQALDVAMPDIEPTVTENMDAIIAMIARLLDTENAYEVQGHVLFHVPSCKTYGELSRRDRDGMISGARVETAPYKRDSADFVLWKPSAPGQIGWDSSWGRGRPGWHIECSAMIENHLGETIDIHGGGADLIFPHHENERAQSICAHSGKPLARFWLHNGFVTMKDDKMSKSLGNILTVRQLLGQAPGEAIRYALLSAHYRHPLSWSYALLARSRRNLDRLYRALGQARGRDFKGSDSGAPADEVFLQALEDDLNTPKALHELFRLAWKIRHAKNESEASRLGDVLAVSARLLGLLQHSEQEWFDLGKERLEGDAHRLDTQAIEMLLAERAQARDKGDFADADRIRSHLAKHGIIVEDGTDGSVWRRLTGEQHG